MNELTNQQQAVELLQQLGLKEYEAKSFVALSRISGGTAKEISEISEVPRTRVYDAIRVLETKGLVEVQHSSPQQFRAVSIDEAAGTLRTEYEERTETLRETLGGIEPVTVEAESSTTHEVWSLSGESAIANRTTQLIDEADRELVLVVGHEGVLTDKLLDRILAAQERGVDIVIGTIAPGLQEVVEEALPDAEVFVSGLEWLSESSMASDDTEISRLLLVDRSTILVSSTHKDDAGNRMDEQAVFGRGFDNGLVTIVRRLMATGLLPIDDPATPEPDTGSAGDE
ncbi:TrmB family transcriptional regulator [Halorarum halophilum]|uniref:TrmB family transcriptional regulator n=1 Tax=Halorarum halophilum TaxID=2743090 RepID=A0A7D5GBP1_9EURY|nr:TrmB family transcriptional regulator [Halobaculum halophilum]QLG27545.1 TrmB family transcriptional regulator [Halobaculum halophilum]